MLILSHTKKRVSTKVRSSWLPHLYPHEEDFYFSTYKTSFIIFFMKDIRNMDKITLLVLTFLLLLLLIQLRPQCWNIISPLVNMVILQFWAVCEDWSWESCELWITHKFIKWLLHYFSHDYCKKKKAHPGLFGKAQNNEINTVLISNANVMSSLNESTFKRQW